MGREIRLHLHQQISAMAHNRWDTVIDLGGVGSGKTVSDAITILDRSKWDTAQWGGLFANTWPQLQAVTGEIYKWLAAAGVEHVFNCRPPREWVEEWRDKGIVTPPARDRYTNVFISRDGLHLYFATLLNQNYKQLRGWEFGWIIVEEFTAGPALEAIEFAMERVRCGVGRELCKQKHRHTKYLRGNPPDDDGHWVYEWLARMDAHGATLPGGEESKQSDTFPNLLKGIGPVIYIPSRTKDNEANLSDNYIENQMSRLDEDTANRRLNGILTRRRTGRAYHAFSERNEWKLEYHSDRDLYVFFDFNGNPAVAGFAHPVYPGEFPDQGEKGNGKKHIGVFGEFFHIGGMDAHQLATAIAQGEKSSNGYMPSNWRGLKDHAARVTVFGDATAGAKQSMTGTTPWRIVRDVFSDVCRDTVSFRVPRHNPLEQLRRRSVNARFKGADGVLAQWVDPRCTNLITDLNAVITGPDGAILKPGGPRAGSKQWLLTHISDGLGYMDYEFFPLGIDSDPSDEIPSGKLPARIKSPRLF